MTYNNTMRREDIYKSRGSPFRIRFYLIMTAIIFALLALCGGLAKICGK